MGLVTRGPEFQWWLEDPALQLRTALSDLFPEEKDLLTVVGRTFPDREPQDVLNDWADTVSKLS